MRRSIEVIIGSGIGNQMFQYALGRALAVRQRRPLVLDKSLLFLDPPWEFDLAHFRLGKQTVRDLPFLLWRARMRALRELSDLGHPVKPVVKEPSLQFCPEVLAADGPVILDGYWQSERYFDSICDTLRAELTMASDAQEQNAACLATIRSVTSVGVHVRRGDYVSKPASNAFHGTCDKDYYDAALRLVSERLGNKLELFVFSDDPIWTSENIRYRFPTTYVDWNASRAHEDLRLLSACTAQVIANSTFSWWAGWLNPRRDKVVVAPRQWYREPGAVSDLPLSRWLIAI